ncbi:MAG: formylglycine-generating enzyme family protein [Rhodospirillaceae bacterium]|jgi:formylglycine-generating enzyme required for sulfatase activity|nr:formylglycine-generating enzyme family protein [Rhodospirillaceae bacterium]MBT5243884.1 formylglycine-generating enzyme family protein [Rhodospirillaceae bacterium]MBT5562933.1 formylglycine-generating enzyme family protein [Rhodospirillaceae bacterium]MBT6241332.1 formylglycine-generating enzyme family protein [Rhodospirillaceae bacterium]MBT7139093.1 formylglycine-generating enzyme family protein [Rhodospirillaceae bacterium]
MHTRLFIAALFGVILLLTATPGQAAETQKEPGHVFRDCDICPEMVVIPAGSFTMGSDGRHKFERPSRKVTIAKPFAMGVYEVTFDEWQSCFDEGGCPRIPDDHKWGRGRRPIMNITWFETQPFVEWLSKKTGQTYRLPSEAEWEYAARAGTTTEFWWGDEVGENLANCRDCKSKWSKKGSAPVGSFAANPFGLYDVHGNEWEWMEDCWNPDQKGAPTDGSARFDGQCQYRVMRSGSWYYFSKNIRSAWRFKNDARVKSYGIGMRVVRELP